MLTTKLAFVATSASVVLESWFIYKHQSDAITIGYSGKGFVVTSGTGSGKSLTKTYNLFHASEIPNALASSE